MGKHDLSLQSASDIANLAQKSDHLAIQWSDGSEARFHFQWLRDNCRSEDRFDHTTGERKSLIEDVPAHLTIYSAELQPDGVHITWSDGSIPSLFDPAWLRKNAYDSLADFGKPEHPEAWGAEYGENLESFAYSEVMSDDLAAAAMMHAFQRRGLVRLLDVPTVSHEVERFTERLAYVREIAFDTGCSGYSWPPNVMAFHCLANEVAGGASQCVDGERVVEQLRREAPDALKLLTEYDVEFRLWSKKADTLTVCPPIMMDAVGHLSILRYANWTIQPLRTVPFDLVPKWYDAWRALAKRVNAPRNRLSHRCEPGELLLINNHRVLHGRDAFDDGEGMRHFQQVYMELDDLAGFRRIAEGQGGAR